MSNIYNHSKKNRKMFKKCIVLIRKMGFGLNDTKQNFAKQQKHLHIH